MNLTQFGQSLFPYSAPCSILHARTDSKFCVFLWLWRGTMCYEGRQASTSSWWPSETWCFNYSTTAKRRLLSRVVQKN